MVGYVGTHGTSPAVLKLEYDAVATSPRSRWSGARFIWWSRPRCRADLKAFVDYAKNPAVNWGTGGIGL
jgi:hypothetical protein